MMMQRKENTTPLPGVWQTIAAGFDFTTKHLWLILLPVLLDSFLWLGPRLSMRLLLEQLVAMLPADPNMAQFYEQLQTIAPHTNLFSSLSLPMVGVPALMVGMAPPVTPLPVTVIELAGFGGWLALYGLLTLVGVGLTAVYFTLIAQALRQLPDQPGPTVGLVARQAAWLMGQLLILGVALLIVGFLIYVPLLPISLLAGLLSAGLAVFVLLAGPVFMLWLVVYLFFAPHGMALNGRSLFHATLDSMQLVRANFSSLVGLLLVILVVRNGLATLLLLADSGSWLTFASLIGHAFVMTSLVAATFIFYRDRVKRLETRD
jgi:hypothetical protein